MLLNLLAALSLASVGAVAGIASNPQSVDGVELDKCSLFERKNAFAYVDGQILNYLDVSSGFNNFDSTCILDVTLESGDVFSYDEQSDWFKSSNGWFIEFDNESISAFLILNHDVSGYVLLLDDLVMQIDEVIHSSSELSSFYCYRYMVALPAGYSHESSFYHLALVDDVDAYLGTKQIVPAIASGLTSVQHYATSLVSGFDALALDNGALTNSMAFAFTLLGIGTAVGICKLTFNWITGRHGM